MIVSKPPSDRAQKVIRHYGIGATNLSSINGREASRAVTTKGWCDAPRRGPQARPPSAGTGTGAAAAASSGLGWRCSCSALTP
jgi:hypothetical protein